MQEIGRAGRDGNSSEAILYFNMNDIGGNTNVKPEVREFCLLETCRRMYVCDHFGTDDFQPINISHLCCDICTKNCECDMCIENVLATCTLDSSSKSETAESTEHDQLNKCRTMLTSYFNAENSATKATNPALITSLTQTLIDKVVSNYEYLNSEKDMQTLFPYLQPHFSRNIWCILSILRNKDMRTLQALPQRDVFRNISIRPGQGQAALVRVP